MRRDVQSRSVLCPEQRHWGRFCLGRLRHSTAARHYGKANATLHGLYAASEVLVCIRANAAPTAKRAIALELIRLVGTIGGGFELTYLQISCVKRSLLEMNVKLAPASQTFPQTHKHTHTQMSPWRLQTVTKSTAK